MSDRASTPPVLGLCAPERALSATRRMGRADYSYHYVLRYFAEALTGLVTIDECDPAAAADPDRFDLLFLPPHRVPTDAAQAAAVFAWEYDTVPTDVWGEDRRNDWRNPLAQLSGAIVHSQYALAAVAAAMPADYPVASVPAPVWDSFAPLATAPAAAEATTIAVQGWVLDSWRTGLDQGSVLTGADHAVGDRQVTISGPVWTVVANPDDARKNWVDAFSAFAEAFRDDPEATLVIKLVHPDARRAFDLVADMIYRPAPFRCRVVVVYGHLPDAAYRDLIAASAFVVNASRGEGQCLPLMEFMSAGVPAIAPDHTAMAEYVTDRNSLIVRSSRAWTAWPHDPRQLLRCLDFDPHWDSLFTAYLDSAAIWRNQPQRYQAMRAAASAGLRRHASREVALNRLRDFLPRIGGPGLAVRPLPTETGPA